jgi:signal peptidase II
MMSNLRFFYRKGIYFSLITTSFFLSDFLTKHWARENLPVVGEMRVIGDFLRFHLVYNYYGIFGFSIGDGFLIRYLLPILAIGFVVFLALRAQSHFSLFVYGLTLGGALGNIFDRLLYGRVTDFIDIGIGRWRWYTFNLADAFLVVGIFLIILFPERGRK